MIKISNDGLQNTKAKPVNIYSNKSHYISVSNNKSNKGNSIKANSRGNVTKKPNEIIMKIIKYICIRDVKLFFLVNNMMIRIIKI
jgi:hypothetical protein